MEGARAKLVSLGVDGFVMVCFGERGLKSEMFFRLAFSAAQTLRFLVNRGEGGRPARVWATNRSVNRRLALRFMVNRKIGFREINLI